jgi:hypothetical protein
LVRQQHHLRIKFLQSLKKMKADIFYEVEIPESRSGNKQISAMAVLNPAESRRLLAKATVALSEVRNALKSGMIIIARGLPAPISARSSLGTQRGSQPKKGARTVGIVCNGITTAYKGAPPARGTLSKREKWWSVPLNYRFSKIWLTSCQHGDYVARGCGKTTS